jgi:hypothetical protein
MYKAVLSFLIIAFFTKKKYFFAIDSLQQLELIVPEESHLTRILSFKIS